MTTASLILDAVDQLDASLQDQCHVGDGNPKKPTTSRRPPPTKREHDDDFDTFKTVQPSVDAVAVASEGAATSTTFSAAHDNNTNTNAVSSNDQDNNNRGAVTATTGPRRYVSPKDFELLKVIGMGAFGKVLQVRNRTTQQVLAMKVISKRLLRRKGESMMENIQAERNILKRVRHPFIVAMHCSFQSREKLFIIMDFLAGGELFLRLGREGIFLEKTAAFYLAEIILALDHLHTLGIMHRDLKPENILLGLDGHVCLTDFGLAKDFSGTGGFHNSEVEDGEARALTICGTQEYMAPEMLAKKGYGRAADYWSLGCIAYEMLKGLPPFESKQGAKVLFQKIMTEKVKMPPGCSPEACKLLKGLLNRDVQNRLGAARSTMFEVGGVAGLKKAEFFKKIDWEKLLRKEIDPPAVFAVESDGDVTHFHEEFTKMSLPRSVIEMSNTHYRPRKVNSDAFRGFSFIQDDFVLPERDVNELRTYWDGVAESDAESVSECASSKMDGEDPTQLLLETTQQQNKKRPPRKRKKKPNTVDSAAATPAGSTFNTPRGSTVNTPVHSTVNTPEPSEAGDIPGKNEAAVVADGYSASASLLNKHPAEIETAKVDGPTLNPAPTKQALSLKPVALPIPVVRHIEPITPLKPLVKPDAWQSSTKSKKKNSVRNAATPSNTAFTTLPATAPPGSSQWANTKTPQSHSINKYHNPATTPARPHPSKATSQQQPVAANGWSSAPQKVGKNAKKQEHASPPAPPPPPATSPSSDWRQHTMSPLDAHGRPLVKAPVQQPTWPSLGGSPAKPAASNKQPTSNASAKPKLAGAWAARGKS